MSGTLSRLAPTAAVAAFVAWCVWPYVSGAGPRRFVQEPAEVPQIAGSLLQPAIVPAGDRDPFRPADADQPDPSDLVARAAEPAARQAAPAAEEAAPLAQVRPGDVLDQLVLDATIIHGDRRLALINGQVCGPGDAVVVSGLTTEPCTVAEITAHKVLLTFRGETLQLEYRGPKPKPAPSGQAKASNKPEPAMKDLVAARPEAS
jgi:hypothetical protein